MDDMEGSPRDFVGIGWTSDTHDASVLDEDGTRPAAEGAEGAVAPVTRKSGNRSAVFCRFACTKRLRQGLAASAVT